jgi:recombination protein RecA
VRDWIDTGNLALNYLCSGKFFKGGIPSGRIIEIFGGSSSCKTLFGLNILKGCQRAGGIAVFLDAEYTLNKEFAVSASHLDASEVLVIKGDSLQKCFAKINAAIKAIRLRYKSDKPIVIVYDSIAASPSEREFSETDMTDSQLKDAKDMPGERAKTCSKELRKLTPILEKNNCALIVINQTRQKIGVMFGNPETTGGGGLALPFYASLRLRTNAEKKLFDKLKNVIGMGVTVKNVKNKVSKPFGLTRNMLLYYDKGINPFSGILEVLIQAGRVELEKAGLYKVTAAYSDGQEIKFKSSKDRNDIPLDALLKCPKLVDAETASEVQDYMDTFGAAVSVEIDSEQSLTSEEED